MQTIILEIIYSITIFFAALTGFGQMPIFKRYYIADLPYLGWLGRFYTTNAVHYISAMILIGLMFYIISEKIFDKSQKFTITKSGYTKIVMLSGLFITGVLILIKNFAGTPFSPNFIIIIDLTHIFFCVALITYSLHTFLTKKKGFMYNL